MLVDLSSEDYVSNIQESYLQMVYDVNKDKEEKVYGVPYATNASGVIYNVDKFKEHGIEIPKTWDEFIDVLEKLQDAGEQPLLMTYKDAWTSNCPWNSIASVSYTHLWCERTAVSHRLLLDLIVKNIQKMYFRCV